MKESLNLTLTENQGRKLNQKKYKTLILIKITPKRHHATDLYASTKILAKNHFLFDEIVQDEEIGYAWPWIHKGIKD